MAQIIVISICIGMPVIIGVLMFFYVYLTWKELQKRKRPVEIAWEHRLAGSNACSMDVRKIYALEPSFLGL